MKNQMTKRFSALLSSGLILKAAALIDITSVKDTTTSATSVAGNGWLGYYFYFNH